MLNNLVSILFRVPQLTLPRLGPCASLRFASWFAVALFAAPQAVFPQGCIPAHYMSLSLGAQGIQYLNPGQWEGDISYRYLHSENVFSGTQEQPQLHNKGGRNSVHS